MWMCFESVCQSTEATHCVHQGLLKFAWQSTEVTQVTSPERLRRMFQIPISREKMNVSDCENEYPEEVCVSV